MMSLNSTVRRARDFLVHVIDVQRARGSDRLPTVRELAKQCRCSPRTMLNAIDLLKSEGVVTVSQRWGIRMTPVEPAAVAPAPQHNVNVAHRSRWEQVYDAIVRDIVTHTYPPGSQLPSVKELCYRYGACYETARRRSHRWWKTARSWHTNAGIACLAALSRLGAVSLW